MARALELQDTSVSGINIEENRLAMMEEDKIDKELHRQKVKARHREERLKAKEERRHVSRLPEAAEDGEGSQEDDSGSDSDSVDGSVADIIDALPDPYRIYGDQSDDDEEVYRGPTGPAAPKYPSINTFKTYFSIYALTSYYLHLFIREITIDYLDSKELENV